MQSNQPMIVETGDIPICPPGFDCGLINACPNYYLPCPPGFFCSSYEGYPDEGLMDFRYADYKMRFEGVTITESNKEYYVDPNRAIQCACLLGFYCPNGTTMYGCPENAWCSEATVSPFECDPLSICAPEDGYYQINFINFFIGIVTAISLLVISTILVRRQLKKNDLSRNIDSNSVKAKYLANKQDTNSLENPIANKQKQSTSIEITFRNIEFSFPSSEKPILPSVSGQIPAAQMTLLLGPSASGKTSLLQVLRSGGTIATAGKVTFSLFGYTSIENPVSVEALQMQQTQTDSLLENMLDHCRTLQPNELSKYVGYVPQDDILDRALTVREQLTFHAQTRLANQYFSRNTIHQIVEEVMIDLNILHIADSIIGGGENAAANISGGQLKRVNIACELVALASPAVLLLDEPTNGLDAAIAFELIESLVALKEKNITIFTVLQQPRSEIFELMDHLLLMGPAGDIVYEGSVQNVCSKLISLGYEPFSFETSDADFCIDVLNRMKWENDLEAIQHMKNVQTTTTATVDSEILEDQLLNLVSGKYIPQDCWSHFKNNLSLTVMNPVFYALISMNAKRLFKVRLRNRIQLLVNMSISVIMAIALASGFSIFLTGSYLSVLVPPVSSNMQGFYPQPLSQMRTHNADQFALTQLLFFLCASLGCASCLAGVPVFANHRSVALREKHCGLSISAYGVGRMIGDLPFVFMTSMVFAGVWCCFGMSGSYSNWMGTCICTTYAASAIGYLTGVSSTGNNANVYAIILTFIFCVFSGTEPSLSQVDKYPVVNWPWYLSFGTWTSEAAYVTWSAYLSDNGAIADEVQQGADTFGYDVSHGLTRSALALLAIGTGLRLIVLIVLNYI